MDKRRSKILLLVEGAKTDSRLMEHLLSVYGIDISHEIVPYNTNIYVLYNEMFRDHDPASLDLLQVLRSHEKDEKKKALFDQTFSDILLIFDLDPQDPAFTAEKIIEMASYFTESTDMGKLYLNYPMVEAFYHMKSIPDPDYHTYVATLEELTHGLYKSRVNAENRNHDQRKFAVNAEECTIVIKQNVEKAFLVVQGKPPENDVFWPLPDTIDILNKQLSQLTASQAVSVLSTCVFFIPEYDSHLLRDEPQV